MTPESARPHPSYRVLRLVLATLVLGALLAVVPRPAFAIERGVRVDTESPELTPVTAERGEVGADPDAGGADPDAGGADPDAGGADAQAAAEPARLRAEASDLNEFELIGAAFDSADVGGGRIRIRLDGEWEPWQELTGLDGDHGPEPGTDEAEGALPASDPIWVGDGDGYELDLPADATDVQVHLVRETQERVRIVDGTAEAGAYQMPTVYSRGAWGARAPTFQAGSAATLNRAVIHHTVNSNAYGPSSVPGMIRGIQAYHMDAQGWWDIGYNFVVDRFGRAWEGRSGSTYEAIIGAHAQGSNTGSTGIAWLGEGSSAGLTNAGYEAISALIAWKLPLHGTFFNGPEIVGHRDVFPTACPGNAIHSQLGLIRTRAVQLRPPPGPYLDVAYTAWNGGEITWGKILGIVTGWPDGNYRPYEGVIRGQLVNMMWNLAGRPPATTPHGFTDVPRASWLTPALDWARENGVITGYPDGSFQGNNGVRRDDIAVLLWRWATSPVVTTGHGFSDVGPGAWSDEALNWARGTGLVSGYPDGTYRPAWGVTRGQILPMLYDVRPFTDVAATAWYQPGAHWGFHQRIALGYSDHTFRGNNAVNRAEGTSMLWRTMDAPTSPPPPAHGWPDVGAGSWFEAALNWGTDAGVVDGKPDGNFHATDPLLRHETILWIWRMAGSPAATFVHGFTDVPGGAPYEAALNWAIEHGIASGYPDNTFRPDLTVTRAQWMMMLYKLAATAAAWVGGASPPTTTLF